MFEEFRGAFIALLEQLRQLQMAPLERRELCLEIQQALFAHMTAVERRISLHRKNIRQAKGRITKKLAKAASTSLMTSVERWQERVTQYQKVLHAFRDIGDGLAFLYLDKWDIKPMAFKPGPGFISGKSGTTLERELLEETFKHGKIAIQNDLTNCLRYGDITIPHEGTFQIVEVKSGDVDRPRNVRQMKQLMKIADYLRKDRAQGLYGIEETVRRQSHEGPEISRSGLMNELITRSYTEGNVAAKVEEGLYYHVVVDSSADGLDNIIAEAKPAVAMMVNGLKFNNVGYYPFTLSIVEPTHWYAFYAGDFVLAVFVDLALVRRKFAEAGWNATFVEDETQPWAWHLTNATSSDDQASEIRVSHHFWGRLAGEFMSLEWIMKQSILPPPMPDNGSANATVSEEG